MLRFDKPNILAISLAAILWALVLVVVSVAFYLGRIEVNWAFTFSLSVVLAVVAYFIIRYSVENFIYRKVKIIYKNIHELKVGNAKREVERVRNTDLDKVSREVSEWAEQRKNEIQTLRERETFRREFIGNISHELKTPVFNIQGYLLTLLDGALDDPDINRKYLKRAHKSVDRMINIIEDLEIISNLESNRVQLSYSSFNMIPLVREVMELLEDKARERKVKLKFKKDYDSPVHVSADRAKIEQVLINLIANAIKYGKQKGKVEIGFFDMHNQVLIEVADNGPGIPQKDIQRIFERFYRVDKSRSREAGGSGLGLAIVKHILEAHQQIINVRSSENAGSTFSFTLKKAK